MADTKRITQINNPRLAQAFVDYMATRGVALKIEHGENCTLLLEDSSKLALVESELLYFMRDPTHSRYQAASWHSGSTSSGLHYPHHSMLAMIRERAGPFTMTVMVACVLLFILMKFIGYSQMLYWLTWPAYKENYFQLWRWFSHTLLHFSLLHLLFNLVWWWYLAGAVEKRLGSGKLVVITLISALLTGWMQAKFSGTGFGGLSGVVYALMGYSWLRGERDPDSGISLERALIGFSLLWLVIGYFGAFDLKIATAAHVTGLILGLAMALVDTSQPDPRK